MASKVFLDAPVAAAPAAPLAPLQPSFVGVPRDERTITALFHSAVQGQCQQVWRRFDRKRDLILPGTGFIYHEDIADIQRWTDGFEWYAAHYSCGFPLATHRCPTARPGPTHTTPAAAAAS